MKFGFISSKELIKNKTYFTFIFVFIFIGLSLNSIFNSIAFAFNGHFPYTTFLYYPDQILDDYFKVMFSYDNNGLIQTYGNKFLENMIISNSYINDFNSNSYHVNSHYHLPPLTTLFCLLTAKVMAQMNPLNVFFITLSFIIFFIFVIIKKLKISRSQSLLLFTSFTLSYPFLHVLSRGHVYSAFFSLLLIYGLTFYKINKKIMLVILSLAANIRPNSIIFSSPLLFTPNKKLVLRFFLYNLLITFLIFTLSLYIANSIDPTYTLNNFLIGLDNYHYGYVEKNSGLAYGSSAFAIVKLFSKYNYLSEIIFSAFGTFLFFYFLRQFAIKNTINYTCFIFILCSLFVLFSQVSADYYLLIFFLPLLLLFKYAKYNLMNKLNENISNIILYASLLMLIPKNYIFISHYSLQVLLNPLILLISLFKLNQLIKKDIFNVA